MSCGLLIFGPYKSKALLEQMMLLPKRIASNQNTYIGSMNIFLAFAVASCFVQLCSLFYFVLRHINVVGHLTLQFFFFKFIMENKYIPSLCKERNVYWVLI